MMINDPLSGRNQLICWLRDMGVKRGAEIGVWTGDFALQLCSEIKGLHLICVDPWKEYAAYTDSKNKQDRLDVAYASTCSKLQPYPHTILRMPSAEAAKQVPDDSLDFVYIDGNHAKVYVRQDLELWSPKVRSGGIVAGHDYEIEKRHAHVEVKEAVDAFMRDFNIPKGYVLSRNKAPSFYWVKP